MSAKEIKVLLIEDNSGDARLVRESLESARAASFDIEWVDRLAAGIERVRRPAFDVVLIGLPLPDSEGFASVTRIAQAAPRIPIVTLSALSDTEIIQDAVKKGAEDCIIKGAFSGDLLARSIRYAIDRCRVREDLAQARDSALESARLRAEFLANMSHEIRTPLNGIIGMTRLLMDTRLTNDQREMLEISRQSAASLLRIVNDVLDFSKISAGKVMLENSDFDLGAAVESVISLFVEQARDKRVELASYIDGDVPVLLRGDPARLCQVMTNLVGNAVKFTPHGQVTVRVGLISDLGDDVVLRFTVRDTGIGIHLEGQRHLFQAFAQADGSTTRKYGGTGLGLAISAQLIELMGGNIGVQSEPGSGSTFWFTATFRKQPMAARALSIATSRLNGVCMLVADRSPAVARIVQEHTGVWGVRCDVAATVIDAMAALKSAAASGDAYDLALVEVRFPEMDGLALGRAIKNDPVLARTRVLGMYSLGGRPDEDQMKAAGMRGLLVKPIKQSQLFNVLSVTMATPAALAERGVSAPRRRLSEIESRLPEQVRARTRVLLVEDNVVNQRVQLRLLERMGYKAVPVNNGREALESMARDSYDIILMDCQMPELDGYTATREIRRREGSGRRSVIIGVTAHALPGDREECLAAGMDDYISKPLVPEELAAIIEKWVIASNRLANPAGPANGCEGKAAEPDEILDEKVVAALREFQRPDESDFLSHLVCLLLDDIGQRLTAMREALSVRHAETIKSAAHTLKGASAQVGAVRIRAACERIEMSVKDGDLDSVGAKIDDLEREAARLHDAFKPNRTGQHGDAQS